MNNFQIDFNGNYYELTHNENYKNIYGNNNSEQNQNSSLKKDITDINGEGGFFINNTFGRLLRDEDQASGKVTCKIYDKYMETLYYLINNNFS